MTIKRKAIYHWIFSETARPLRFIGIGGGCGLLQMALLGLFTYWGIHALLATCIAFFLSAQVNFLCSSVFTWHDRTEANASPLLWFQRWLTFHGTIACSGVLNASLFWLAHRFVPLMVASAFGIAGAALLNFCIFHYLVFRKQPLKPTFATRATLRKEQARWQ